MSRISKMASVLANHIVDLGDEVAVMKLLRESGFDEWDIISLTDDAIERARVMKSKTAGPE